MLSDSNLAADDALRAERRAARDPSLSGDDRMLTNFDVVGDLNQIVELHASANDSGFQ